MITVCHVLQQTMLVVAACPQHISNCDCIRSRCPVADRSQIVTNTLSPTDGEDERISRLEDFGEPAVPFESQLHEAHPLLRGGHPPDQQGLAGVKVLHELTWHPCELEPEVGAGPVAFHCYALLRIKLIHGGLRT